MAQRVHLSPLGLPQRFKNFIAKTIGAVTQIGHGLADEARHRERLLDVEIERDDEEVVLLITTALMEML